MSHGHQGGVDPGKTPSPRAKQAEGKPSTAIPETGNFIDVQRGVWGGWGSPVTILGVKRFIHP